MSAYVLGFVSVMIFLGVMSIGAMFLLSIESHTSEQVAQYMRVRRVNTNTIEVVDANGKIQRWERPAEKIES